MQMDDRKKRILRAIVQDYIASAEPIGSRTIARKFDLGVSPATIRNEMSDLEELGLIEQPHTSAGRIPSDAGYRYYVDFLMDPPCLGDQEKVLIERETARRIHEIQEVINQTSKLLSQLTSLTSVIMGPQNGKSLFSKMYFLPYQPGQAIMVVVKENGVVENHIVDIGEDVEAEELQKVADVLNRKMQGHSLHDVRKSLLHEIYSELSRQRHLLDSALAMLEPIINEDDSDHDHIYLGGALNMLNQPEFRDLDKVKGLLKALEEDGRLKKLLSTEQHGLRVSIGGENRLEEFQDCSVISASLRYNGELFGVVGILGPTRMDYAKAMAIVDYTTRRLNRILRNRRGP
ncbi:GAF domain-like, c-terminal [Acididesulfobacillus acetoxydans]|uniref:Heat-inducible transcription repressor HrcA n=1 Tax=Acididesulfobacillus acetoxydans TaxID=1561005 RepID=A0A8S0WKH8_9FIRM|nr:heat-inducible transcriptional repressor HrcA [Acididesulfobacillus acetoxydans]CAA7599384.1 GAF domain-like, c-terminal [Acididesulfobacillus acetoxydans]CEJ06810.1 Heat-inducible transcription repressor HrcA [Acididesulfobacillus acetoxydans]